MTYRETPPEELRRLYIRGTLRQRYGVAIQRIDNPGLGPSLLVNVVSALEGFARAVAMHVLVKKGTSVEKAYRRLRNLGPVDLITTYICPAYNVVPEDAFGLDAWSQLPEAIEFRNLLIHEATFLHGGTSKRLIAAAQHILEKLAQLTGVI